MKVAGASSPALRASPVLSAAVVAVTLSLAASARADEPRRRDIQLPMLGNGVFDVGYIALGGGAIALGSLVLEPPRVDVAPLDGLGHREHSPPLNRAADFSLRIGLGVGIGLAFLSEVGNRSSGTELGRAPLIMTEGAIAASALTQLLKDVFGVCRPRDWDDRARRCMPTASSEGFANDEEGRQAEARRSFPSGHNAPLAGMAGAAIGMYALPSGHRPELLPVALTATGFALTTVILREQAGAHSWVDTLGAFVTGGLAGFATAALHLKTTSTSEGAAPVTTTGPKPTMVGFGGTF